MNGPSLRRDLQVLPLSGNRDCVIVDDISGRFARVQRTLWQLLHETTANPAGQANNSDNPKTSGETSVHETSVHEASVHQSGLWNQAVAAGWTQSRQGAERGGGWSPLSIRIPLGSLDAAAGYLVRGSDLVFSPRAILFWTSAAILGAMMLLVRWEQWSGSIPSLSVYLRSLQPLSVAIVFVLTKTVHEFGHAVACRRLGSRVGVAGVWFLCFMPCPYVDVTEVWRQPNALRRAAVMAAGMIAEGVLCVIAIWVWVLAESTGVRLAAMNVVLICGVSTVLFNANPLMRYDGYFILSDLVDSTNLREEARRAWQRLLVDPVSRWPRLGGRFWAMLSYHAASSVYRVMLTVAIAAMLLAMADRYGAWRITAIMLVACGGGLLVRKIKGGWAMWNGTGKWSIVSSLRRRTLALGLIVVLIAAMVIPTPRYRHVEGRLRAADASPVYLPGEGMMEVVEVQIGDRVVRQQRLAKLRDCDLMLEIESNAGRARVMANRSRSARLASLQTNPPRRSPNDAPERQWDVLDAATLAIATAQRELDARRNRLDVLSPSDGVVLPATESSAPTQQRRGDPNRLTPGVGEPSSDRSVWCRVARSNRLQVALRIDAGDHREVQIGCPVRFTLPGQGAVVYRCEVGSVSPMHSEAAPNAAADASTTPDGRTHVYQALCDVPETLDVPLESLCRWDGAVCDVIVHLPPRALWQDVWEMAGDLVF